MKRLDDLSLDAAELRRIDEILILRTGRGVAGEVADWRRRRRRHAMIVAATVLLVAAIGLLCWRAWS